MAEIAPLHDRGCVFFSFGDRYALRLLVSIFSLRRFYAGSVTVFLRQDPVGKRLEPQLRSLDCDVVFLENMNRCETRHRLFRRSPYRTTLTLDGDMLFQGRIDALWEPLEREGLLVTRFFCPPWGVEGTREQPAFANRVRHLEAVQHLVDAKVFAEARRRLIEERIDVNVGVMGISRPRGNAFLEDFSARMDRDEAKGVDMVDELLTLAMLPEYPHHLAGEEWNCPADEYFRRTNLADAIIIHYFADGFRVRGARLGRNPATWAGKKWYEVYREASHQLDLRHWQRVDPQFAGRTRRIFADGTRHGLRLVAGAVKQRTAGLPRRMDRGIRRGLQRVAFPLQQTAMKALAVLGFQVRLKAPQRATVIVLSYRRMNNIPAIVRNALLCDFVERVVVSNNNPEVDLKPRLPDDESRLVLVQQEQRRWPSFRYELARDEPGTYFLCIDDDVFPSPWQLRRMFRALLRDPSAPLGTFGQVYNPELRRLVGIRRRIWSWRSYTQPVDVLLQTYAFTRKHLDRYFALLSAIGVVNDEIHSSEDVVISFAGDRRPTCTDTGYVFECLSSRNATIATHQQDGFEAFRQDLYQRLRTVSPLP